MDLFSHSLDNQSSPFQPLADRMRPQQLMQFVGQKKLQVQVPWLWQAIERGELPPNLIIWGPPGTGKTTFAKLLSSQLNTFFIEINAVDTGAKKIKELGQQAKDRLFEQRSTLLFIDEIHRLNKSQQDVLLPFTEKGIFTLVGATTENPSYELNAALLSRCRVVVFEAHSEEDLSQILHLGLERLSLKLKDLLSNEALQFLLQQSQGDARQMFQLVEDLLRLKDSDSKNEIQFPLSKDQIEKLSESIFLRFDKKGEEHYNTISAFIKSVRGSDPDAAIYYLARMVQAGQDPKYIARRLVILASEDIGNADPRALSVAMSGMQAVECVGLPEAGINLAQVTTYLASAPKSNASYAAYKAALKMVKETGALPIPNHLKSGQTRLEKQLGIGVGYNYSQDGPTGWVEQNYLPKKIQNEKFYEPSGRGFEKTIQQYMEWMKQKPT